MFRLPRCRLIVLSLLPLAISTVGKGDDAVFVDRFQQAASPWRITHAGTQAPGIVRQAGGTAPGLRFVTQGLATAAAPWNAGAGPFEFSFELELDYGTNRAWRWPGVLVGLTSAAPDQMGDQDVALYAGAIAQGVMVGVRTGPFFDGYEERPGVWRWTGRNVAPRYVLNQGGSGGHDYSVPWPGKRVDGLTLRMVIRREIDHLVRFEVFHPHAAHGPWWTGEWTLPDELASVPLTHVVVKTVIGPEWSGDPTQRIREEDEYRGRVCNIQGRTLPGPERPVVGRVAAESGPLRDGSTVTVHRGGSGRFLPGTTAEINGRPVAARVVSDEQLSVTLSHLQPCQFNRLTVVAPSGLASDCATGIPAGRFIDRILPREASLQGGDVVTLVGGGFDEATRVTFGETEATVVERRPPSAMKVRVPPGSRPGPVPVVVTSGDEPFAGEPAFGYSPHPYLWFNRDGLVRLRKKSTDPACADYRKLILDCANRPEEKIGQVGQPNHSDILHAHLWAYLLSADRNCRDRLMASLAELLVGSDRFPGEVSGSPGRLRVQVKLDEFWCHNAEAVATVYDALFEELSADDRTRMLDYLDRSLDYYLERVRANDWWYRNNPSNTVAVGNGCGGIVALSLIHSTPAAADALALAVASIRERYKGIAADGSCVEGNLYWDYGFSYQLLLAEALANATGDERELLADPRYEKTPAFVQTQLGGAGTFLVFNDTQPWLTGMGVTALFGSRLDDDLLRWMTDRTVSAAAHGATTVFTRPQFYALAFRARDERRVGTFPGVPNVAHLPLLHWGVLRSDGREFLPGLVVGVKGRDGELTHHAQEDLGGFTLDARGENLLLDPGYYQGEASKHSLPLIDGAGPDRRGRALITDAAEHGPWRTMTVDATHAYEKVAGRMRRVFVMHGDEAVIVLDDLAVQGGGRVTHQLQCAAGVSVSETRANEATVAGSKGFLAIQVAGPGIEFSVEGPLDFERSWVYAREGASWYRLRGDYAAERDRPLITVLLPYAKSAEAPRAKVEYAGKEVRVVLPSGAKATFTACDDGWRWAPPMD